MPGLARRRQRNPASCGSSARQADARTPRRLPYHPRLPRPRREHAPQLEQAVFGCPGGIPEVGRQVGGYAAPARVSWPDPAIGDVVGVGHLDGVDVTENLHSLGVVNSAPKPRESEPSPAGLPFPRRKGPNIPDCSTARFGCGVPIWLRSGGGSLRSGRNRSRSNRRATSCEVSCTWMAPWRETCLRWRWRRRANG